jgi:hypothetical protein
VVVKEAVHATIEITIPAVPMIELVLVRAVAPQEEVQTATMEQINLKKELGCFLIGPMQNKPPAGLVAAVIQELPMALGLRVVLELMD